MDGVRHGLSNPQIAERLRVGLDAVKYHVSNALQKLGLSDRRQLRRWQGARRNSALASGGLAMNQNPELDATDIGGLGQVARSVADIEQSMRFYGELLGLPLLYRFGTLAFYDLDGVRLLLSQGDKPGPESILYLRVGDIHGACRRLTGQGVHFVSAPHLIHTHADGCEEWMAFFNDPEGRPLALLSQVRPAGP